MVILEIECIPKELSFHEEFVVCSSIPPSQFFGRKMYSQYIETNNGTIMERSGT